MLDRCRRWTLALGMALGAHTAWGSEAYAQSVNVGPALEALNRGESGAAEAAFERVLHERAALPADVAEAHRQLAALRAAAGDTTSAEDHAAAAIAIDPNLHTPDGATAAVQAMFTRARQSQGVLHAGVELTLPEQITAGRVTLGHLVATHVPRGFNARIGVRCVAENNVVASRDFESGVGRSEFSIDALPGGTNLRCVAILATHEGVVFDRRTVNASVAARRGGAVWLAVGGAALAVAIVVTVAVLASSSGADPNQQVQLGVPRIVP